MKKLIDYINGLTIAERDDFEAALRKLLPHGRTSIGYLRKAASKGQKLGAEICVAIEQAASGAVTRRDLRDDWAQVWPELKDAA